MTLVIGLGNKARHGKDTAGEAVVAYYARNREMFYKHGLNREMFYKHGLISSRLVSAKIYKWADALYAEVNEWLGTESGELWASGTSNCEFYNPGWVDGNEPIIRIPEWVIPTPNAEKSTMAPLGKHAKLLQWWGTEYRRSLDVQYWVKKLVSKIENERVDIALITDTRFKNEAQAVKDLGGYNLNISRKNADGTPFVDPSRPANHPSEIDLDDWNWDLKIINSHGHAALAGELAITYVEYLRALRK